MKQNAVNIIPILALFVDTIIGDPKTRWHPVVMIGNLIELLEGFFYCETRSNKKQRFAGALLVIIVLLAVYGAVWASLYILTFFDLWVGIIFEAIILSFAITPHSLAQAGQEISKLLKANNIVQARIAVSMIVGRDTEALDEAEITRATVETVAENIVDGIVSPLIYFILGGAALAFLYRAVNTMDSMLGYKNERYLHFGMVAARVDDIFNYIPARLTGIMILITAVFLRYDAKSAMMVMLRDATKHPSPNSGIPEAGVAGALGIKLGGINYYDGIKSFRPYMGDSCSDLKAEHIDKTVTIMYIVTVITVCLTLVFT